MDVKIIAGLCLYMSTLLTHSESKCPSDLARRAQQCLTDLAWGVATPAEDTNGYNNNNNNNNNNINSQGSGGSGSQTMSGAMPLDYRKIREYCAEDGHMPRFVQCVEELSQQCPELPPEGPLRQLINPQRVRTSVPNLCNNVDAVEAGSECMNKEITQRNPCKARAHDTVKNGIAHSATNATAMFFLQCRFFSVLAECQRVTVTEMCGGNLGDLHADFLLSFVPDVCVSKLHDLHQDHADDLRNQDIYSGELRKDVGQLDQLQKGGHHQSEGRLKNDAEEDYENVDEFLHGSAPSSEGQRLHSKMPEMMEPRQGAEEPEGPSSSIDKEFTQQITTKQSPVKLPPYGSNIQGSSRKFSPVSEAIAQEVKSDDENLPKSRVTSSTTGSNKTSIFSSTAIIHTCGTGRALLFALNLVVSLLFLLFISK